MPRRIYIVEDGSAFNSAETMTMLIELLFGFFGWWGVGWLFAGNIPVAIGIMIGFWLLLAVETVLVTATAGCLICFIAPLDIVLLIYSGIKARDYARRVKTKGNMIYVFSILVIIIFVLLCGLTAFCGAGTEIINKLPTMQPLPTMPPFPFGQ